MKEIEILVPGAYQGKIKKRLQPNSCFEENIKFALDLSFWNGNSFFDKFYKVQNFFPYAIPIVL
ncbi:hypothetical protein ABXM60_11615, partial [Enterococcus faecium]